jgi:Zn-dependent peptidase ImmA (M78 family)
MAIRRAERAAQRLLAQHSVTDIPVPVDHLAQELGAQLSYQPFDGDVSGMLFRDTTRVIIGINANHAPTRQRFSIAHELGHLLLHQGRAMIVDRAARVNLRDTTSSLATDTEEIEANQFAAELLMPAAEVEQELRRLPTKRWEYREDVTSVLARTFGVSQQAMSHRLVNLGLQDYA